MEASSGHEALLASIHQSAIATVVTNPRLPDNPICDVNAAFERLTLYSAAEINGRNCRFLTGPDSEPEASETLGRAVAEARPVLTEILNYRRDGSTFRNAVMIAPLFGDDGAVLHFIGSQVEVKPSGPDARMIVARRRLKQPTERQQQVLKLMAKGFLNKQIAWELGIAEKTVKMHRAALLHQLQVRSSAEAIRLAIEAGF
jgi:PAS domain S-box-containing protein